MAYSFDGATQYLENTSLALTYPFSMSCWFYVPTGSVGKSLMNMGGNSNLHYHWLFADDGGPTMQLYTRDGGTGVVAETSNNWGYDAWHHALGVVAGSTSRAVYLDGGGKGTNATDRSPTINQFNVGVRFYNATYNQHFDGYIAEPVSWDVALNDDNALELAAGADPRRVHPQNLIAYNDLVRGLNDKVGGYTLTPVGSPPVVAHVPIFYSFPARSYQVVAAPPTLIGPFPTHLRL